MVNENLIDGGPSKFVTLTQYTASRAFRSWGWLRRKAANIGEVADYMAWLSQTFGPVTVCRSREELWELMAQRVPSGTVQGAEFGVAWGYGTGWWLDRLPQSDLTWDGFDRFTGLPRGWRDMAAGSFNAHGNPPPIDDPRVAWHVGDVEDHVAKLHLDRSGPRTLILLFDLDIYEPSSFVWRHVKASIRPGDILYFDEAFDADERWLLSREVLPAVQFNVIGATPMALALQVVAITR